MVNSITERDIMSTVSDEELKKVIADFLEMGHVENIIAMFRRYPEYFDWTGELLEDDRLNVRLGLTILFEEMQAQGNDHLGRALPSLARVLENDSSLLRGEAVGILGIIGSPEARVLILSMKDDQSPQVREMVSLVLEE